MLMKSKRLLRNENLGLSEVSDSNPTPSRIDKDGFYNPIQNESQIGTSLGGTILDPLANQDERRYYLK